VHVCVCVRVCVCLCVCVCLQSWRCRPAHSRCPHTCSVCVYVCVCVCVCVYVYLCVKQHSSATEVEQETRHMPLSCGGRCALRCALRCDFRCEPRCEPPLWMSQVTSVPHKLEGLKVGLAITVYIQHMWPYIWWFPCQKVTVYAPYIYNFGQPYV